MKREMLPVIHNIIQNYGDSVFGSMPRTNAMLLDLAPGMTRERILIRNFIEINGYRALKNAQQEYAIVRRKLIQTLTDTFCLERAAAEWVTGLFAAALGYETNTALVLRLDSDNQAAREEIAARNIHNLVAMGKAHTVAVASDGTIFAHGKNDRLQCDVGGWRHVAAIAAGDLHTVGLRTDGTLLATGSNTYDQCDVTHLDKVASVYAFGNDTVCVMSDGTAWAAGRSRYEVSHFNGIKSIAKYPEGLFGIREDGTVLSAQDNATPQENGEDSPNEEVRWATSLKDTVQIISTYVQGSIALKKDGRLYKMNAPGNYFAPWRDVVSIADLSGYFAILRADGTVRILSFDRDRPHLVTEADQWQGIIAIYGKYKRLIGLTQSHELVAVCTDPDWISRNGSLEFVSQWYPIGPGAQ